jgi:ATP-dependent protease ClpP protease subunit
MSRSRSTSVRAPNTFLLHQPAGGAAGRRATSKSRPAILRMRPAPPDLARETGQSLERIEEDTHRNFWLDAESAVKYGIVGKIIQKFSNWDEVATRDSRHSGPRQHFTSLVMNSGPS